MLIYQFLLIKSLFLLTLTLNFDVRDCQRMDNALLELRIIDPKNSTKLELWYKHKVCQNCRKKKLSHGSLTDGHMLSIDTSHEYDFIITNRGTAICQELEIKSLGECGHYNLSKYL